MEVITRKEAIELGATHYYTGKPCVHGHVGYRRTNDRVCMVCDVQQKTKKQKARSPEERSQRYYANRERFLSARKASVARNRATVNAGNKYRKHCKTQRTPIWVDSAHRWMIREAYSLAQLREKVVGGKWHVDHIIPIKGVMVSGLHVIENLQVIPAIINIAKKNKFEVA